MQIESVTVSNYKSYLEAETVKFMPGFNVITGQNSAGKTALLEAIKNGVYSGI